MERSSRNKERRELRREVAKEEGREGDGVTIGGSRGRRDGER